MSKKGAANKLWTGYGEISGRCWNNFKVAAERRKYDFKINIKYAWDLFVKQDRKCALSGEELGFGAGSNPAGDKLRTASLDRIDNTKGYIKGNLRWVSKKCNMLRGRLDDDEFLDIVGSIARHNRL